jgi:hypothetical protein
MTNELLELLCIILYRDGLLTYVYLHTHVRSIVRESTITNMATARNTEVIADRFNAYHSVFMKQSFSQE